MSAIEALRKAAETLRMRAQRATQGDWSAECLGSEGYRVFGPRGNGSTARERRRPTVATVTFGDFETCKADSLYIAAMHPGIGLRLADLLDSVASDLNAFETTDEDAERTDPEALELARHILGEAS